MPRPLPLTLFDLDYTLLDGDSDVLWCNYLIEAGVLERDGFAERNAQMDQDYRDGRVGAQTFCDFYVGTLTARTRPEWPWPDQGRRGLTRSQQFQYTLPALTRASSSRARASSRVNTPAVRP